MGLVLLAVVALFVRANPRSHRAAAPGERSARRRIEVASDARRDETAASRLTRIARSPRTWYVGFALAVAVVGTGAVAFVGGVGGEIARTAGLIAAACLGALLVAYLFLGTYLAARQRGRPEAQAVAEGLGALGGLFVLAIVTALVVG